MHTLRLFGAIDVNPLPHVPAGSDRIAIIVTIVASIAGSIAFLIMVIAGFKYVSSRGDAQAVARAKDTIVNAAIGLVVIVSAYAIVAFTISNI